MTIARYWQWDGNTYTCLMWTAVDHVKFETPPVMISNTFQHVASGFHDCDFLHRNAILQPANISKSAERKKSARQTCWRHAAMRDNECPRDGKHPMTYQKTWCKTRKIRPWNQKQVTHVLRASHLSKKEWVTAKTWTPTYLPQSKWWAHYVYTMQQMHSSVNIKKLASCWKLNITLVQDDAVYMTNRKHPCPWATMPGQTS